MKSTDMHNICQGHIFGFKLVNLIQVGVILIFSNLKNTRK